MEPEVEVLVSAVQKRLDQMCRCLEGLSEVELNWHPPAPETNSLYVLGMHILGNARAWALGIALGQPVQRDRPAEFKAEGPHPSQIVEQARVLSEELRRASDRLSASALDQQRDPPQHLWGAGQIRQVTARECLIDVIQHASEHVGQMLLTRDLARASLGSPKESPR